jgi:hypothetical protein
LSMISDANFKEEGMSAETRRQVKELLGEDNSCYVLITCGEPSPDGKMQIDMAYEGDPILAAYLLEGAQTVIDEQIEEQQQNC